MPGQFYNINHEETIMQNYTTPTSHIDELFTFQPITEQEATDKMIGLKEGTYNGIIADFRKERTKNGDNMFVVSVTIDHHSIKDYLLPDHERMSYRVREFFKALGLIEQYELGSVIRSAVLNKKVGIVIKHVPDKDDKTIVRAKINKYTEVVTEFTDSDILF